MPAKRGTSARRHAQAAYHLALAEGQLDRWLEELRAVSAIFSDATVKSLLEDPKVPVTEKLGVLQQSLAGFHPLVLNLAQLLVAKDRAALATAISDEFERLVDAHHGLERVEVTTAIPLEPVEIDGISQRISRAISKGVKLSAQVEPSIGGGIIARIGDRILDGSIRAKLQELKRSLVAAR